MMNKSLKKIAVVFTLAAMTITASVSSVSAKNVYNTYEVQYVSGVDDYLNVRSDASLNAAVIGSLPNGAAVEVTGYVEDDYTGYVDWVEIIYNGMNGYVSTDYLASAQDEYIGEYVQEETTIAATVYDTVVYPRVDVHLSGATGTTWCSLNTDGYYYNEVGTRFTDLGNGRFIDAAGNELTAF